MPVSRRPPPRSCGSSRAVGGGRPRKAPSAAATATCSRWLAPPASTPKPGASTAPSTSCVARRRSAIRTTTVTKLFREFLRKLDPFPLWCELLVGPPVRPRFLRKAHLLERHRQIEVRVGVQRVEAQRLAVAGLRFGEAVQVVIDVSQIEVCFEEIRFEANRALIQRLCFSQIVATVMIFFFKQKTAYEIRIALECLPIREGRLLHVRLVAIVERGTGPEVLFGPARVADHGTDIGGPGRIPGHA